MVSSRRIGGWAAVGLMILPRCVPFCSLPLSVAVSVCLSASLTLISGTA